MLTILASTVRQPTRCNNKLQSIWRSSLLSASSSSTTSTSTQENKNDNNKPFSKKQDFVKVEFEPGEWDENETDPLFNPPWKNKARILSADEMNHRPIVHLKDRAPLLRESGFLPTWLFERQREGIYTMYLEMMEEMSKTGSGTTSHEYVCYVIAQKFNISKERVAGVIQLRHNEEQLKKEGVEMHDDCQKAMDEAMQKLMMTAYQAMGYRHPPDSYIEDPNPFPRESTRDAMSVDDLFDEEQAETDAISREKEKAQFILNNKRFIEDIHPSKRRVKLDDNTQAFMKQKYHLSQEKDFNTFSKNKKKAKYSCKYIDTTLEKKRNKKNKKVKKQFNNVVIEDVDQGKLRAATMEEIYNSSYKPNRNPMEFMYMDAKKGWLDKTMHQKDTWGKAPVDVVDVQPNA